MDGLLIGLLSRLVSYNGPPHHHHHPFGRMYYSSVYDVMATVAPQHPYLSLALHRLHHSFSSSEQEEGKDLIDRPTGNGSFWLPGCPQWREGEEEWLWEGGREMERDRKNE